jgi:CPA2 family monovalent cation:H+ antiporter-2
MLAVAAEAPGTALTAALFGVSLAVGAFVAGLVVGEGDLSHQVVGETVPLRDVLVGLFFVSAGMLVDPLFVAMNLPLVALALALMVLAKGALVAGIAALFRYPARTAPLTGVALAQCAEFSFLLARVGQETGAVTPGVFSLMLAAAAGSIALSPTLHAAGPVVRRLERWRPAPRGPATPPSPIPRRRRGRGTEVEAPLDPAERGLGLGERGRVRDRLGKGRRGRALGALRGAPPGRSGAARSQAS